jgi:hypothetical protein
MQTELLHRRRWRMRLRLGVDVVDDGDEYVMQLVGPWSVGV